MSKAVSQQFYYVMALFGETELNERLEIFESSIIIFRSVTFFQICFIVEKHALKNKQQQNPNLLLIHPQTVTNCVHLVVSICLSPNFPNTKISLFENK